MASPAVLADLARKAPHSPLAKRLFANREAPATSASTLTEVISYGTAAKDAADPYNDSTPSDREIGRQQIQHVPKDVIDRLDANEQRQAEMHEQLLQQGKLLNDLLASQANMSTMIAQLKPSSAPSTVPVPAQVQAPAPAPVPAQAQQGTAAAVTGKQVQPTQGTAAPEGTCHAICLNSPAACMQLQLCFRDHDAPLFSDSAKRWTTNGPSMYAFIRQVRQELCCALEEGVRQPGFAAHQAIQEFTAAVVSWLTPRDHSMTSILMEGIGFSKDSAACTDIDNLVCVAVRRWDQLEEVIAEVNISGKYDRSLCDHAGIMDEPGFKQFDPVTAAGAARWMQLRRLIIAYFKVPGSATGEMQRFRTAYRQHRQGCQQMRQFISTDDRAFKDYILAGGQVSDQTRIEWMQEKLSVAAVTAMGQHEALLKTLGRPRDTLQTDWLVYSDALISVCSEVQGEEQVPAAVVPAAVVPAAPAADKKRTAGRQLGNEQVTAIHRYAAAIGMEFREVSLEGVEAAPGGVEKYKKMTSADADREYKDSLEKAKPRLPAVFPVLLPRKSRGAEAVQKYKQAVLACLVQTREL